MTLIRSGRSPARPRGSYIDARGVRTYYEAEGAGDPLVLLHGSLCAMETFEALRRALVDRHRVFLPERRGHGRTPDVDGPYGYDLFTDDTIAFMETVGLPRAHLLGFGVGATIGLLTAIRRPDLVASLVHVGQPVRLDGIQPELRNLVGLDAMPQGVLPPILRELYEAVTPDAVDHWDIVLDKAWQMVRTEPDLDIAGLAAMRVPTLVIVADHDIPTMPHAEEISRALPDGRLVVVPRAGHWLPMERPDALAPHIREFLAEHSLAS